jgi:hypothetical protein
MSKELAAGRATAVLAALSLVASVASILLFVVNFMVVNPSIDRCPYVPDAQIPLQLMALASVLAWTAGLTLAIIALRRRAGGLAITALVVSIVIGTFGPLGLYATFGVECFAL